MVTIRLALTWGQGSYKASLQHHKVQCRNDFFNRVVFISVPVLTDTTQMFQLEEGIQTECQGPSQAQETKGRIGAMDKLTPVCSRVSLVLLFLWATVFCDRVCSLRLNSSFDPFTTAQTGK